VLVAPGPNRRLELIAMPAATHPIDWKDGQSMIISNE
jgi:hypothetical protein